MTITEFQGQYRWLSNFYPCEIMYDGRKYDSVEHAYMSAKSNDPAWKTFCQGGYSPGVVKRASRSVQLRPNWEEVKLGVMLSCLRRKFSTQPFRQWLLETGDTELQEGNTWGDKFWGIDLRTGTGKNHLGRLLMQVREELRSN